MPSKLNINFVMSNNVESGIFNGINNYFKRFLSKDISLTVTQYPVDQADIYHYHRPNLENNLKKNSVVTVHHDLDDNDIWFRRENFIDRYFEAKKIICLNSKQKTHLSSLGLSNCELIPHGVDQALFTNTYKNYDKNKLFKIGVISKRYGRRVKGEAYLFECMKRLDPNKIEFLFVGEGRSEENRIATELGFKSTVYEYLPYILFDAVYKELNALMIPSLFEGGPANVPEALYCGVPILGRKIAMINDLIEEGVNGHFLSGELIADCKMINALASNRNRVYEELIEKMKSRPKSIMTWKAVVEKHEALYRSLVDSNGSK